LDNLAAELYTTIAAAAEANDLAVFWRNMAGEERAHADLWERIARAGRRNRLPPIFDEPQTVRESLERILERARTAALQWESGGTVSHPFVLACRLELFMLHPAFATLFYFARTLFGVDFYTTYDKHLERFIQALQTYCQMMPELELLGRDVAAAVETKSAPRAVRYPR